jgi:hypothetical protein
MKANSTKPKNTLTTNSTGQQSKKNPSWRNCSPCVERLKMSKQTTRKYQKAENKKPFARKKSTLFKVDK